MEEKQLEILEALDRGEITKGEADQLMNMVQNESAPVTDERHPDISFADRAIYKNFSTDPEAAFNYMQKEYPDLNFKKAQGGDLLVKRPEEKEWRKLDPSGFDIEDISDIGYDVPAAVLEQIASAAGGVGGGILGLAGGPAAPVTVPGGALAGASLAGAATGTATEGLRQTLGKYFGVAEEYDPSQLKTAAAFGAASPFLFGTGAGGKQIAKAGLKGTQAAAVEAAQRGAGGYALEGARRTAPKIGSLMSGYTPDALKRMSQLVDEGAFEGATASRAAAIPAEAKANLDAALTARKAEVGQMYGEALEALDVVVDADTVEKPLQDLLGKYRGKAGELIENIDSLPAEELAQHPNFNKATVQNYLHLKDQIGQYSRSGSELRGAGIKDYMDELNDLTLIRKNVNVQGKSKVDQELIRAAKQTVANANKSLDQTVQGKAFKGVKKEYQQVFDDEDLLQQYFKDPKKTETTLRNLGSTRDFTRAADVADLGERYGVDLDSYADDMYVMSEFFRPPADARHIRGTSGLARSVPLSLAGAGIGYGVGQQTDMSPYLSSFVGGALGARMGSPAAMLRAAEMNAAMKRFGSEVKNLGPGGLPLAPQTGAQIWQNIQQNQQR